jgi:general secretion pathway protein K
MKTKQDEQGFVLLLVLGMLALLALFGTSLTSRTSVETKVAAAYRTNAWVEAAADSAIHETAMQLLQGRLTIDTVPHLVKIAGIPVVIQTTDEAAKINPNAANAATLRSLLSQTGAGDAAASRIADAILNWRQPSPRTKDGAPKRLAYEAGGLGYAPSNRPFDSLDELSLVIGMTPAIFNQIRPFLTVYSVGDVRLDDASPVVAQAVLAARAVDPMAGQLGFTSPDQVVLIRADATAGAARFARRAVVRFKAQPNPGETPYQFLAWEQEAD